MFAQASNCCGRGGVWLRPHRQRGWRWGAGQQVIVPQNGKWTAMEQNVNNLPTKREEEQKDGLRLIGSVGRGSEQFWKCDRLGAGSCQLPHWDYMRITDGLLGRGKIHKPGDPGASRTISIISNDAIWCKCKPSRSTKPPYVYSAHHDHHEHTLMGDGASQRNNRELPNERWTLTVCYFFQAPAGNNTQ